MILDNMSILAILVIVILVVVISMFQHNWDDATINDFFVTRSKNTYVIRHKETNTIFKGVEGFWDSRFGKVKNQRLINLLDSCVLNNKQRKMYE